MNLGSSRVTTAPVSWRKWRRVRESSQCTGRTLYRQLQKDKSRNVPHRHILLTEVPRVSRVIFPTDRPTHRLVRRPVRVSPLCLKAPLPSELHSYLHTSGRRVGPLSSSPLIQPLFPLLLPSLSSRVYTFP